MPELTAGRSAAEAFARTGDLRLRQGHPDDATRHISEALAVYQELGSRSDEADARNSLGEVLLATGQPGYARAEYATALRLAAQAGDKYQQKETSRWWLAAAPARTPSFAVALS